MVDGPVVLSDWFLAATEPGAVADPAGLTDAPMEWIPASVPGTVASALRTAGRWSVDDQRDFDAMDWWYRTDFRAVPTASGVITFGGIATIAEVWLNGALVHTSENMFEAIRVSVAVESENELVVVCRSLRHHLLAGRRARPRWKTRLVELQQLRWARATLLGRMPSWTPSAAPVGLWREVTVLADGCPDRDAPVTITRFRTDHDGLDGTLEYAATIEGAARPVRAELTVAGSTTELVISGTDAAWTMHGSVRAVGAAAWFPATHGEPTLHPASLRITTNAGEFARPLGPVGFRTITVDTTDGGFALGVNGVAVFARGACWTPPDVVSLHADADELHATLVRVAGAGLNLVRITGTTVYETETFYSICDELGIMVWQDFMFANLDYPIADPDFARAVDSEARQILGRLAPHPCLAVVGGGSEVEQQAAMMGLDASEFANDLGRVVLPALVQETAPGAVYVPCSPSGGTYPFSPDTGVAHYYGVGAYRRPLTDARHARVRFASECLAFSNVPSRAEVDRFLVNGDRPGHAPAWKARVPRDRGAGWDFEDIRDFYVRELFACDPFEIRATDPDRYLDLGRAAVYLAIESTLSEWRRPGSGCSGAVLLMLRDLWPGAGWGVLDSTGAPKSGFDALARTCAPTAVLLTDEGLNGLRAHVVHDGAEPIQGSLRVRVFGADGHISGSVTSAVTIPEHGAVVRSVDEMLGGFRDLTFAYRFGPPVADVVSVDLLVDDRVLAGAVYMVGGPRRDQRADLGLHACGDLRDGVARMHVTTEQFAQFVSVDVPGCVPDVNWFHLAPGDSRTITFTPSTDAFGGRGEIRALNQVGSRSVKFKELVAA